MAKFAVLTFLLEHYLQHGNAHCQQNATFIVTGGVPHSKAMSRMTGDVGAVFDERHRRLRCSAASPAGAESDWHTLHATHVCYVVLVLRIPK